MDWFEGLALDNPAATGIVAIAVGVVLCFWGYRIFRLVVAVCGGIVGAGIGVAIGQFFGSAFAVAVLTAACAILGAVAAFLLYRVGVFLAGFLIVAGLGAAAMTMYRGEPGTVVPLAAGVLGGVLALAFQRWAIAVGTALAGASGVSSGAALVLSGHLPGSATGDGGLVAGLGIGGIVLAVAGTLYQVRVIGKKKSPGGKEALAPRPAPEASISPEPAAPTKEA